MYNKLQVALEELDTLEQPQDALVTNESELEVAEVVEEIKEEAEELETTEELVEELEKQEAALENLVQGLRNVQNPTEDTVRLASVTLENIIARIPKMEGRAALVDHEAIRTGVALEALASSTPEQVLAVALEEADKAKQTIMERIKAFFKWLGERIKHFFKLVTDSVYRLQEAVKGLKAPEGFVEAKITNKGAAKKLRYNDQFTVGAVVDGVKATVKFSETYFNSYNQLANIASSKLIAESDREKVKNFLASDENIKAWGIGGKIGGDREVEVKEGAITIKEAGEYKGNGEIVINRSGLDSLIKSAQDSIKAIDRMRAFAKSTETSAKASMQKLQATAEREGAAANDKIGFFSKFTGTGLMSVSKLVALAANDVRAVVSLANAAIKDGGKAKDDKKEDK
jgi:hypothetical protein